MKRRIIQFLILFGFLFGCSEKEPAPAATQTEASIYLEKVLLIMETNSIYRYNIDWAAFKAATREKAANAKTIADTYQAIEFALKRLNDGHSYYDLANGRSTFYFDFACPEDSNPPDVIPPAGIGYVRIAQFSGRNSREVGVQFAQSLQATIKSQDNKNLKGWIVDLRGNGGGNMWPMLAGIGPILGEGIAGYFIGPDGSSTLWHYSDGASLSDGFTVYSVPNPYTLINPNPKVAVLIGLTASSGEALAISFVGRPNTRLFGAHPTCGQTTGIVGATLSDGAILGIAAFFMADRNKNKFIPSIMPDESGNGTVDGAVAAAVDWLNK